MQNKRQTAQRVRLHAFTLSLECSCVRFYLHLPMQILIVTAMYFFGAPTIGPRADMSLCLLSIYSHGYKLACSVTFINHERSNPPRPVVEALLFGFFTREGGRERKRESSWKQRNSVVEKNRQNKLNWILFRLLDIQLLQINFLPIIKTA